MPDPGKGTKEKPRLNGAEGREQTQQSTGDGDPKCV